MAGLNIGDVFMKVLADMTGFEADVTKKAAAAGDKAGMTLGQRLSKGMTRGLTALGAGAGVVFGVAARGAAELTDAMAKFQAETGATQEELDSARKSVLELSKSNLQSFDEIASAQAKLRTDMGLTQAQAEASTAAFLKYATATGQNAADSVASFDDILDAWNLTADDATGIMDKLIASHQKFGGVLVEDQDTLSKLAPALQAANLSIDDGISLIGLFNDAGVDASAAVTGMTKALTKVKSPEELQALIKDIASTDDAFLRGQKAADLFGAKAGQKLSQALGGANIDDYAISMDQAAGATERAAKAIENTPLNQLKMALRSIAAPAIEAGQAFGPLILALSQLGGGKLVAAVTGALGGLAGRLGAKLVTPLTDGLDVAIAKAGASSRLMGAWEAVGTKWGGALGKFVGLGAVIGLAAIAPDLERFLDKTFKDIFKQFTGSDWKAPLEGLGKQLDDLPWPLGPKGAPDWAKFSDDAEKGTEQVAAGAERGLSRLDLRESAGTIPGQVSDSLAAGKDTVAGGATTMMSGATDSVDGAADDMVSTIGKTPQEIAQAIVDKQGTVANAMAGLRQIMKDELYGTQQANRLVGNLVSQDLAHGLQDGRPGVRTAATGVRDAAMAELEKFIQGGGKIGRHGMEVLAQALKSKDPAIRAQARHVKSLIETNIKPNTKPAGVAAGQRVVAGLNSQSGPVGTAAARLARTIFNSMLNNLDFQKYRAGERQGKAGGGPVEPIRAAAGASAQVPFAYQVNERGQELFVPAVRGRIMTAADARAIMSARAAPSGGNVNVNLSTYGLPMRAETPLEVAMNLRRVGRGLVRPHRRLSWSGG